MSFLAQAKITEDNYIIQRVKACAASQQVPDPHEWTMANIWTLSTQEGWAEAYNRVLEGETIPDPAAWAGTAGADPNVITDQMILAGVTGILSRKE